MRGHLEPLFHIVWMASPSHQSLSNIAKRRKRRLPHVKQSSLAVPLPAEISAPVIEVISKAKRAPLSVEIRDAAAQGDDEVWGGRQYALSFLVRADRSREVGRPTQGDDEVWGGYVI